MITLVQAGLGYLRWSQMLPMLVAWAFVVLGMLGALLVGFQEQGIALSIWLHEQAGRIPGMREWLGQWLEHSGAVSETGGLRVTDEQLTPLVIRAWAVLSAVLLVGEWLWRLVRPADPETRPRLRWKLGVALFAAALAVGVMAIGLAAAGAGKDIGPSDAIGSALVAILLLFGVSAYSLTVSHVLAWMQRWLDAPARSDEHTARTQSLAR